nr:hypothetical protein [Synechococcus lacustris]
MSSWLGEESRIHLFQSQGRALVTSAADQGASRPGLGMSLRNQAQTISLKTQRQPIAGLEPQQLAQSCRYYQLPLR